MLEKPKHEETKTLSNKHYSKGLKVYLSLGMSSGRKYMEAMDIVR